MKFNVGEVISTLLSPSSASVKKGILLAVGATFFDHLTTSVGLSLPPKEIEEVIGGVFYRRLYSLAELNPFVASDLVRWHGLDLAFCLILIGVGTVLSNNPNVWVRRGVFVVCLIALLAHGIAGVNNLGWIIWMSCH